MSELLQRSVTELRSDLDARKISAEELMRATLSRIEATQSRLNCFTSLRDEELLIS